MTLEQLRVLVKLVDAGSFTRAADVLGMQRSNVSRVLAQLEAELGVTLLERTTRKQHVSEAGRAVYERAVGVLAAIEDTLRVTQDMREEPRGLLRVTCGVEFGMAAVGGWVERYLERYPQVNIEVEYATRELDLVHEGFDLAIRAGPLTESRLAARQLGQFDYGLYASPRYLKRHRAPRTPDELASHALVIFTGNSSKPVWTLHHPAQREAVKATGMPRLLVNAGAGARDAIVRGLGIGQLPHVIANELVAQGQLQRVLAPWHPSSVTVHAVYPSNRYLTPKVRAFVDLALAHFPHGLAQATDPTVKSARSPNSR
jgi:LysR family transcriptional regulator, regulator for bpeEF and oprC